MVKLGDSYPVNRWQFRPFHPVLAPYPFLMQLDVTVDTCVPVAAVMMDLSDGKITYFLTIWYASFAS